MNPLDLARIATRGQRTSELLDRHGMTALHVALARQRSLTKGTSYEHREPAGNNPDDYGADIPNDPTGDLVCSLLDGDRLLVQRLTAAIATYEQACGVLTDLILRTVDTEQADTPVADDTVEPGDAWCHSCYRDARYLEPVTRHGDGRIMHKRSCRWCALFTETYGQQPPVEVLRHRHAGNRVTPAIVERALRKR